MAGPSDWMIYDDFLTDLGRKLMNLNADTFKVALFTSASSAISQSISPATYTDFAVDGHEVPNGMGYATGGYSLGSGGFVSVGSHTVAFSLGDATFTASGGTITVRAAVIYDSTDASKRAVAYVILDSAPANIVIADGQTMQIIIGELFQIGPPL